MGKRFFELYKVPLLISITLSIVLIALKVEKEPLLFSAMILGSLLGTFILDLDYIIFAYFLEPHTDYSQTLKAFLKHGDLINAFSYTQYHKNELNEKPLSSLLFQLALAALSIYVVSSPANYFIRALVLSAFLNSIYRLSEHYFNHTTDEWFWTLKSRPSTQKVGLYLIVIFGFFIYCLSLF